MVERAIARAARWLALAGGALALVLSILVVVSVLSRRFFSTPVPGDFELVQMGTALAIFAFLPICQLQRSNIIVDTFTAWLPRRAQDMIDCVWDLVYAAAMGTIGMTMIRGATDSFRNFENTMVLQFPVWPALSISALLCLFLAAVCVFTAAKLMRNRA